MSMPPLAQAYRPLRMGILIAGITGVVLAAMVWFQVHWERRIDLDDVDRRSSIMAQQFSEEVLNALDRPDQEVRSALESRLEGAKRFIGFAIFRPDGQLLAASGEAEEFSEFLTKPVLKAVQTGEITRTVRAPETHLHILAIRLTGPDGSPKGVLAVVHDISYLDERVLTRLIQFGLWILPLTVLVMLLVAGITWGAYERPLYNLAEWMRRLRTENVAESLPPNLPASPLASETGRLATSFRAARSASRTRTRTASNATNLWTGKRLRDYAMHCLQGGQLIVVSNREPYMHQWHEGKLRVVVPAGGLVTALDPVLQACGGVWVAHGAGDADRETADARGRLNVPPGDARYTLRRVWLSREEEEGYYYGFSNEGLWPLCHLAYERPIFRAGDWERYVSANRRFAEAVLEEAESGRALVLVQDYHLALVPQLLKEARPDLCVGMFWHIPWPSPETFRICPWRAEILQGMLGADLIGFHLQQYCNNFLDTVDRILESRLDWDHFAVELKGHTSLVRPFPISVESWSERGALTGEALARQIREIRESQQLGNVALMVGLDRIDYTKGLPERFRAVARLFEKYPEHREKVCFVQLGAPSRTHLRRYRDLITELDSKADEINWRFQTEHWKPVHFLAHHHDARTSHAFLSMASVCVVSSLHDGMNLVAKEFVAAQESGEGMLVLSEFAGAARELSDALIINPYDTEQFADALHRALVMEPSERQLRMERMRRAVEEHNIYLWLANFLSELAATPVPLGPCPEYEPEATSGQALRT